MRSVTTTTRISYESAIYTSSLCGPYEPTALRKLGSNTKIAETHSTIVRDCRNSHYCHIVVVTTSSGHSETAVTWRGTSSSLNRCKFKLVLIYCTDKWWRTVTAGLAGLNLVTTFCTLLDKNPIKETVLKLRRSYFRKSWIVQITFTSLSPTPCSAEIFEVDRTTDGDLIISPFWDPGTHISSNRL